MSEVSRTQRYACMLLTRSRTAREMVLHLLSRHPGSAGYTLARSGCKMRNHKLRKPLHTRIPKTCACCCINVLPHIYPTSMI